MKCYTCLINLKVANVNNTFKKFNRHTLRNIVIKIFIYFMKINYSLGLGDNYEPRASLSTQNEAKKAEFL